MLAKAIWEKLKPEEWPLRIADLPEGSALVGGAVRDVILKRIEQRFDLDFVVPSEAVKLANRFALNLGAKCIVLDYERDIARLIIDRWTIDFASYQKHGFEKDLLRRDFRVNAIALTLKSCPEIIDPSHGIKDLTQKKLVALSEQNLIDDPLRLLRAFRLMAELNLSIDPQTKHWILANSALLSRSAPERVQSELNLLVAAPWADEVLPILKESGLLTLWSDQQETCKMSPPFKKDARALSAKEAALALPLARLTYLLSDDGLLQLRFSRRQRNRCQLLRKWQNYSDDMDFQSLKEEDRLQLHKDLEADLPALLLGLSSGNQKLWLRRWRDQNDPLFHPASPVDGHTLQVSLGIPSGPQLGKLITYLCKERAFDRVQNQEEAFLAARYWLKQNITVL